MNSIEIRTLVIQAVFSDDQLMQKLVLKGGSALELVHKVVSRGSFDVDLSMAGEFDDLDDAERRLFHALRDRFDSAGYVVFDEKFRELPPEVPNPDPWPWWGGYALEFKILPREKVRELGGDREAMRKYAEVVSPDQGRRFRIEISKREFCEGAQEVEFADYMIYVYSPEMAALEKLRAICQQMVAYSMIPPRKKRPRARDFFDIHEIVVHRGVDFADPAHRVTCRQIFAAKKVPVELVSRIIETREFHREDWPRVQSTVREDIRNYDHYFDFVVAESRKLEPLGIE